MMKKALVIMMGLVMASSSFAKSIFDKDERVYYGVRLGLSVAHLTSDEARFNGNRNSTGLNFGVVAGINLSDEYPVILESGLYYTERGGEGNSINPYKTEDNKIGDEKQKTAYDLNYLVLPVVAKYRIKATDELSVQPFFGGYFSLGISGKIKYYKDEVSYSSFGSKGFQRFDGGLRFGCGVEYQMLYAEVVYDLGLSNISDSDFDKTRNRCWFINLGVNF